MMEHACTLFAWHLFLFDTHCTPAEIRSHRSFSQVWQDALDLTQADDASDVQCLFHYTNELGFKNITDLRKTAVELFAMPSAFMKLM